MAARRRLVKDALMKALRLRRDRGIGLEVPVCPFDLANDLNIEVRFLDLPSLEGVYSKWPEPAIIVSSLRPPGRQVFTCAHELGHHIYGHGFCIDELLADGEKEPFKEEEFLVNCFAGFLLMPKKAVTKGFTIRGWSPETCTPIQVYTVAGWLGVGYATLIMHLRTSLGLLNPAGAKSLSKTSPKEIKGDLLGKACQENLVVVDPWWSGRAIDLQVGDWVLAMPGAISEKPCVDLVRSDHRGTLFQAVLPGLGRVCNHDTGWSAFVRVSRRGYIGCGIFRHEEEVKDEYDSPVRE